MKRQILINAILVSLFLVGTVSAFSQKFSAGARVGVDFGYLSNFPKLKSHVEESAGSAVKRSIHTGFQGGLVAAYSFNKFIGLQGELIFDRKGEKLAYTYTYPGGTKSSHTNYDYKVNYSITYLTIPILIKAGTEIGKFKIHGLLGPYVGFGLAGKGVYTGDINNTYTSKFQKSPENPKTEEEYLTPYLKRLDVGLTIGVEPAFKVGPGDIFLDLRYNYGLLDIQNPYKELEGYFARDTRSFGISVGYLITFGK
jgi:hypothetical protein